MGKVFDWSATFGPVSGTIATAGAVLAGGAVANAAAVPWQWVAFGGVCSTAAVAINCVRRQARPMRAWAEVGGALAATGWAAVAVASDPFTVGMLGTLAGGAVIGGALVVDASHRDKAEKEDQTASIIPPLTERGRREADWTRRLAAIARVPVEFHGMDDWKDGFTLDYDLHGGATWKQIQDVAPALAADAKLPAGCKITVEQGITQGTVCIKVPTRNQLADEVPYPTDYPLRSINEQHSLGIEADGTEVAIPGREASALMIGPPGSGKSNTLNVRMARLAECTDVLVWDIDLFGGISRSWVEPYLDGDAIAPGVDWAARTEATAHAICDAAIAIIKVRESAYAELRKQADDESVPVSAKLPAIIVRCDEFADLPQSIKNKLDTINNTGRKAAVRVVVGALRPTGENVPASMKKHSPVRLAMAAGDADELAYLFGWSKGLDPEQTPYAGCAFIRVGVEALRTIKIFRVKPSQVREITIATANRRPRLDAPSIAVAGPAYTVRIETMARELDLPAPSQMVGAVPAPASASDTQQPSASAGDLSGSLATLDATTDALKAAVDAARNRDIDGPEVDATAQELTRDLDAEIAALLAGAAPTPAPSLVPEPLASIIAAFAEDEREYISTADLAAGIGRTGDAAALGHELSRPPFNLKADYRRRPEYPEGKATRGFFISKLREAAAEFERGEREQN